MLSSHVTPHPPSPPLESNMAQITACNSLPGGAQSCSRCALITNYKGTETPYTGGLDDLELIRGSSGGPVCFSGVFPLPTVLFPDWGLPWNGCTGTQLAPGSAQVCSFPNEPPCTDSMLDQEGWGAGLVDCTLLAHTDLVLKPYAPCDRPFLAYTPFSGRGDHLAPTSRSLESPHVASWLDAANFSGLSQALIDTITQARAVSHGGAAGSMGRGRVWVLEVEDGDRGSPDHGGAGDWPEANLLHRWKAEDELRDWQDAAAVGQKMADGS